MKNRALIAALLVLAAVSVLAQDAPPIRAKFEFTAEQVRNFGSTHPIILPAVPGFYYRIAHGTFLKRSGGTFTYTNPGHFVQIQYANTVNTPALNFKIVGLFNVTDEASSTWNPAEIGYVTSGTGAVAADIGGAALKMGVNAGGSYTGDGADCILDLYYWLLPATSADLDLVDTTPLP